MVESFENRAAAKYKTGVGEGRDDLGVILTDCKVKGRYPEHRRNILESLGGGLCLQPGNDEDFDR